MHALHDARTDAHIAQLGLVRLVVHQQHHQRAAAAVADRLHLGVLDQGLGDGLAGSGSYEFGLVTVTLVVLVGEKRSE